MHDFKQVARAHRQMLKRADDDDDDKTTASTTATTAAARTTSLSSSSTADRTTSTSSSSTQATTTQAKTTQSTLATSTSSTALIDLTSILGGTTSSLSTSSSRSSSLSSTSSSPTSSSGSSTKAAAASPSTTSSTERALLTSTATRTSSGTATAASSTASETAASHGGLSGTATGGIVAGCVLVGLALLIFAIRKTFIQRRKRKRNTWGAGAYPDINDKYADGASTMDLPPPIPEKTPNSYLSASNSSRMPVWAPPRPVSPNPPLSPAPNSYYVAPPQASYNNPMMDEAPFLGPPGAGIQRPASSQSIGFQSIHQSAAVEMATVRVLYIPTLPDELSIMTGEVVTLIKAYDDGWALCSNARGEQGVVPLECLERTAQAQANMFSGGNGQQGNGGDWRNMKRLSSLSNQ